MIFSRKKNFPCGKGGDNRKMITCLKNPTIVTIYNFSGYWSILDE